MMSAFFHFQDILNRLFKGQIDPPPSPGKTTLKKPSLIRVKGVVLLNSFKKLIKKWVPQACPFRLCKSFIPGVGFVESLP